MHYWGILTAALHPWVHCSTVVSDSWAKHKITAQSIQSQTLCSGRCLQASTQLRGSACCPDSSQVVLSQQVLFLHKAEHAAQRFQCLQPVPFHRPGEMEFAHGASCHVTYAKVAVRDLLCRKYNPPSSPIPVCPGKESKLKPVLIDIMCRTLHCRGNMCWGFRLVVVDLPRCTMPTRKTWTSRSMQSKSSTSGRYGDAVMGRCAECNGFAMLTDGLCGQLTACLTERQSDQPNFYQLTNRLPGQPTVCLAKLPFLQTYFYPALQADSETLTSF